MVSICTEKLGWVVNGVKKENKKEGEILKKKESFQTQKNTNNWPCTYIGGAEKGWLGKKRFIMRQYTVESG